MQRIKTIRDVSCKGQRVFVRVDFNVPLDERNAVSDDARIVAALPTIKYLIQAGARVILATHLGRPDGERISKYSTRSVAQILAKQLGQPVLFLPDCVGEDVEHAVDKMTDCSVVLLENLRFHREETENSPSFSKQLAALADIYVNDAFGTAHRAHASTEGITHFVGVRVAGFLMERELKFLGSKVSDPDHPFTVILGGSKVSDKIEIIKHMLVKADNLLIGGAMAFTFSAAHGHATGNSLVESDRIGLVHEALKLAKDNSVNLFTPVDFVIANELNLEKMTIGEIDTVGLDIPNGWWGVDIGPQTVKRYSDVVAHSQTILWNGPLGIFEIKQAARGTFELVKAIASSEAVSIIGGGDLGKAVRKSGYESYMTFISTGVEQVWNSLRGGSCREWQPLKKFDYFAMYRKFLIAANWKMNNGIAESVSLIESIGKLTSMIRSVDMLVCPPFIALDAAYRAASGSLLRIGAQNMYPESKGAFTGEISFSMLRDCNVSHVILGHSERRIIFGESNEFINRKVCAALKCNLLPILCVGESRVERENNETFGVVETQLKKCLKGVSNEQAKNLVIAYEPVWAIGTGKTATPEIAQEVHSFIRVKLAKMFGEKLAGSMRILYGGSMKAANAEELLTQPDIDGGLIGGASLVAHEFCSIVGIAERLSA